MIKSKIMIFFKKYFILVLIIWSILFSVASALDISHFRYIKEIIPPKNILKGNFFLVIDENIYKYSNEFLTDLRVIDNNNKEIKYSLKKYTENRIITEEEKEIKIIDYSKNFSKRKLTFILDLDENTKFHNSIRINPSSSGFSKKVRVFGSDKKDGKFRDISLSQDIKVYLDPGKFNFLINYRFNNYRYIKLVFSGYGGELNIESFYLIKTKVNFIYGLKKKYETKILKNETVNNITSILIKAPFKNLPIDYFYIISNQVNFDRHIRIYSSNSKDAVFLNDEKRGMNKPFWREIFNDNFSRKIYNEENNIEVTDNENYYLIVIENKEDDETLKVKNIKIGRFLEVMHFENLNFEKYDYRLIFGNRYIFEPKYRDNVPDFFNKVVHYQKERALSTVNVELNPYFKPNQQPLNLRTILFFFLLGFSIIIILWFIYKIKKERKNRDIDDDRFVNKL